LRNIEESVAERIKSIARERNWSINDVILHILRHSLGFGGDDMTHREIHDVAMLTGTWDAGESAASRYSSNRNRVKRQNKRRLARAVRGHR
jgi:hypothetical protein